MGDIADSMIDGQFDYITGEYIGDPVGYPRTGPQRKWKFQHEPISPSERKIKAVRKELAILIQEKQKAVDTKAQKNNAVEEARKEINLKYGKGWRERGLVSNDDDQWSEEDLAPYTKK